ncbi:HlyD family type I secretion periplasmic adaptor subunit [Phenylobacterium sp.]|uniref:HlyD family type I secretion periplasmic adaptor subunit n=1 Tax=Phenylobacterium sp. TaxID=1871053 RepID=UPI0035C8467D
MASIERPSSDYRKVAAIGLAVVAITFGVFGIWAAFAPLGSAVIGHGTITVETNRKTIQHLEGGILRKILVREGDEVEAGQVLFELDPVQTTANVEIARNQLYTLLARGDRLVAERDGLRSVNFSPELVAQTDPAARQAMRDELLQFQERRSTLLGQVAILRARAEQYQEQIKGIDRQQAGMEEQIELIDEELEGLRELYEKQLVPRPRVLALERERAQIQSQIGRAIGERAQAEKAIGEARLQAEQIDKQFQEDVAKELADTKVRLAEIREKYTVARDVAERIRITSPVTGTAQNLRVFTEGAVIRPAEPLIDIVPEEGGFQIQAQFSPADVDNIHPGMDAELRFPSFHARNIPLIEGKIATVSRDRLVDEGSKTPYFLVTVDLREADLPESLRGQLVAGMPAEVVVPTGDRTLLQYLFDPLTKALRKSLREE